MNICSPYRSESYDKNISLSTYKSQLAPMYIFLAVQSKYYKQYKL